jgi:hypothetical protein
MAYTMRIRTPPQAVPNWYPPLNPKLPWEYYAKHVYMRMVMQVLIARKAFKSHEEWTGDSDSCAKIADALGHGLQMKPLTSAFFNQLRDDWNAHQDGDRKRVEAEGQVVLKGCEPFEYTEEDLDNDLKHFGVYNAIACQYGGYSIE